MTVRGGNEPAGKITVPGRVEGKRQWWKAWLNKSEYLLLPHRSEQQNTFGAGNLTVTQELCL